MQIESKNICGSKKLVRRDTAGNIFLPFIFNRAIHMEENKPHEVVSYNIMMHDSEFKTAPLTATWGRQNLLKALLK